MRSTSSNRYSVLADRLSIKPDLRQRLVDTVEICYHEAAQVIFENAATGERLRFDEKFACKFCNIEYREPEPILFSFNSPAGACPRCQGFGNTIDFSMDLAIPNRALSVDEGAVEPWTKPQAAKSGSPASCALTPFPRSASTCRSAISPSPSRT